MKGTEKNGGWRGKITEKLLEGGSILGTGKNLAQGNFPSLDS